jgi:hypothetical protein
MYTLCVRGVCTAGVYGCTLCERRVYCATDGCTLCTCATGYSSLTFLSSIMDSHESVPGMVKVRVSQSGRYRVVSSTYPFQVFLR